MRMQKYWLVVVAALVLAIPFTVRASDPVQKSKGIVKVRPMGTLIGTWVIGDHAFSANEQTVFKQENGELSVGACAEVSFVTPADPTIATEIDSEIASDCSSDGGGGGGSETSEAFGAITSFPANRVGDWVIDGTTYVATAQTTFKQESGQFAVGVCVEVRYTTANNVNTAVSIETQDGFRCNTNSFENTAHGIVETIPTGGIGTWVIGGVSYDVNADTRIEQEHAPIAVGDCVSVEYTVNNGVLSALHIEHRDNFACGIGEKPPVPTTFQKIYAPIDVLPAAPFTGDWKIGGIGFSATITTTFDQEDAPFAVGVCVEAKYQIINGVNQLLKVESKTNTRCQGGDPSIFKAYGNIGSFPAKPYVGEWIIGGTTYSATLDTAFKQEYGAFSIGASVEVKYKVVNDTRIAVSIESHVAPGSGRDNVSGELETRPSDDTGTWVIDGVSYTGDDSIEVDLSGNSTQALAPNTRVMANFYRTSSGAKVITSITIAHMVFLPAISH